MNVILRKRQTLRTFISNTSRIISRYESNQQPAIFHDPNEYKAVSKPTRVKPNFVFSEKPIERFFLGEFDFDLLEYPQIGSLAEVNYLFDFTKIVRKNVETILNLHEDSLNFPTRLENLGKLKLYGLKLPKDYGGYEFCESEVGYIHETLIFDQALSKIIGENEDLGSLIIMKYGSEAQKKIYLPKIANGEISTCFAHFESFPLLKNSHDKTKAYESAKGENFTIAGKKTLVYNAHLADLIIVSANTADLDKSKLEKTEENKQDEENDKIKQTFFLLEKNTSGVHISHQSDFMSLNDDSFSEITFENVVVPVDAILGEIHQGEEIVKKVLSLGKFNIGPICCSVLKHLSSEAIDRSLDQILFKEYMNEHEFVHREIGLLARDAYVIESMAYCLSGRLYWFKEPDLFLESLIVKVLASDALHKSLQRYLQLMGPNSLKRKYRLDKLLSDSLFHQVFDDTNDNLKFALCHQGLEHARKYRKSDIAKKVEKAKGKTLRSVFELPTRVLDEKMLKGFLHPSLEAVGNTLNYEIQTFDKLIGKIMKLYNKESTSIPEAIRLKLADMVILMYATAATAGRASRSYSIGLQYCDTEVKVALSANGAFERKFRMLEMEISNELKSGKNLFKFVGNEVLSKKKYAPVHPFTRR